MEARLVALMCHKDLTTEQDLHALVRLLIKKGIVSKEEIMEEADPGRADAAAKRYSDEIQAALTGEGPPSGESETGGKP